MDEEMKGGIADMGAEKSALAPKTSLPRVNFRPFLVCALGLAAGTFFYAGIRFGGLVPSDFLIVGLLLPLLCMPFSKKRILLALSAFLIFACAGAGGLHLYTGRYLSGAPGGEYEVEGTVVSICVGNGYTSVEMDGLLFDGVSVSGKMNASVSSEQIRPGDRICFSANVTRNSLPHGTEDSYFFVNDIRYSASAGEYAQKERGFHPFLALNRRLFDMLRTDMGGEEADISYALLTGNARMVDEGFMTAVRAGGIAHIFAVSGLHIGILYGAVLLLCRPMKKYAFLPALFVSLAYCALCGFSVSSVRALLMCAALSLNAFLGRKNDLLSSTAFAGTVVLLFLPAQWLSVGFRLSFGACIGLALFSGSLSRLLKKLRVPRFLAQYLSASLSVQLFTFPILLDAFGYFSVWGLLLNLVLVPLLPAAFLTLLVCALFSLVIPPAAAFFLMFPKGLFSALLFLFAFVDFGYVLTGFALGAGGVVWLTSAIFLSERFRLARAARCVLACACALLFALSVFAQNSVFGGVVIDAMLEENGAMLLIETPHETVLVLGGETSLSDCRDFLARRTAHVDAAVILSEDAVSAVNVAAFTGAERIYLKNETATGLKEEAVFFGESFSVGELTFRYESDRRMTLFARGFAADLNFGGEEETGADLSLKIGDGALKYYLDYGIMVAL